MNPQKMSRNAGRYHLQMAADRHKTVQSRPLRGPLDATFEELTYRCPTCADETLPVQQSRDGAKPGFAGQ
jgi:hypothetical protein